MLAEGAAALSRRGVGSAVFGGMLAASTLGIFVIPVLYVVIQQAREWVKGYKPSGQETPVQEASVQGAPAQDARGAAK